MRNKLKCLTTFSILCFLLPVYSWGQQQEQVYVPVNQINTWIQTLEYCKSEVMSLRDSNNSLIVRLSEAIDFLNKAKEEYQTAKMMQYDQMRDWAALVLDWTVRFNSLKEQSELAIKQLKTENTVLKIGCVGLTAAAITFLVVGLSK